MIEFKGRIKGELEIKRFYLPGLKIRQECPECHFVTTWDEFDGDNFSYPIAGEWFDHPMYCTECDHEWNERLRLSIILEKE